MDFEQKKLEMLQACDEIMEDIAILSQKVAELKEFLQECNSLEDALKRYPNDINIEDGLKHIRLS